MINTLRPLPSLPSDTPRTDEVRHNAAELAMHARKLERENAELRKDKDRLEWLLDNALIQHYPTGDPDYKCGIDKRKDIDEASSAFGH
jgi:hypothetical protein